LRCMRMKKSHRVALALVSNTNKFLCNVFWIFWDNKIFSKIIF